MNEAEQAMAAALQELHRTAGRPGTRKIAEGASGMSHDTVARALRGDFPRWGKLSRIVEYLDGDVDVFRKLWMASERERPVPKGFRRWDVTLTYRGQVFAENSHQAIQALKAEIGVRDTGGLMVGVEAHRIYDDTGADDLESEASTRDLIRRAIESDSDPTIDLAVSLADIERRASTDSAPCQTDESEKIENQGVDAANLTPQSDLASIADYQL